MSTEIIVREEQVNALQNNKLKVKIKGIATAIKNRESSDWLVVSRLASIVTEELYVQDFGTLKDLAEFMGLSVNYIKRMVRAASLHENEIFRNVTVSKTCEFLVLNDNQLEIAVEMLIQEFGCLEVATVKAIRDVISIIKKSEQEGNEQEDNEQEGNEQEGNEQEGNEQESNEQEEDDVEPHTVKTFTKAEVAVIVTNCLKDLGHGQDVITKALLKLEEEYK